MPPHRGPGSCWARGRVSCSAWDRGCPRGPPWSLLMLSSPSSLSLFLVVLSHHGPFSHSPSECGGIWASSLPVAGKGPPRPCWCCGSGVLSTPVLAEHPRDSSGLLGAVPPAGSTCSGQRTSFHSPAWKVATLGQQTPSKGAWNSTGNQPGNQLNPASKLRRGFGGH